MEVPAIVDLCGDTYTVRCRYPVPLEFTGITKVEARDKLEAALREATGEEVEVLLLGLEYDKPWVELSGIIPDDEATAEWLAAVAEIRRQSGTVCPPAGVPSNGLSFPVPGGPT